MDLVNFKYDIKNSLPSVQVENGTIHAVVDNGELYVDYDGQRVQITDIEVHATEAERRALLAPKPKFHYCKDSGNLWYKNGVWKLVGQQGATKTLAIAVGTSSATSAMTMESGWLIKHVTFVPDTQYTGDTATISIAVGSQSIIPADDLKPSRITDQYESSKYTKITTAGEITVTVANATAGSGTVYVDYAIL